MKSSQLFTIDEATVRVGRYGGAMSLTVVDGTTRLDLIMGDRCGSEKSIVTALINDLIDRGERAFVEQALTAAMREQNERVAS